MVVAQQTAQAFFALDRDGGIGRGGWSAQERTSTLMGQPCAWACTIRASCSRAGKVIDTERRGTPLGP